MLISWYFARDDKEFGPFTAVQMREQVGAGRLRPADAVWKSGMKTRVRASRVKDLFPLSEVLVPKVPALPLSPPAPEEIFVPEDSKLVPLDSKTPIPAPPAGRSATPTPAPAQPPARKWRVVRISGGVILSQDGVVLRYRKKCSACAYEDSSVASMPIRGGICRSNFFCPRCRKNRQVEAQIAG